MRREAFIATYSNILHLYLNDYVDLLSKKIQKDLYAENVFENFLKCIKYILRYIRDYLKASSNRKLYSSNPSRLTGKIWVYANTVNQFRALESIYNSSDENVWVSRNFKISDQTFTHLLGLKRLRYLVKFPQLYKGLKVEKPFKSKRAVFQIFEVCGQYEFFQQMLTKYKPKAIVISNDHSLTSRSLLLAAKDNAIPTIYIQHATVTSYFPNLEADLNLLEGQQALDAYKACGPINGKVKFIGMPKFDDFVKYRKTIAEVRQVGICLNPADNISAIHEVLDFLSSEFPRLKFTYRKHPRDSRGISVKGDNLYESDSKSQDSFSYLLDQDLLIAGDTSIHLEAALLNIPSIYYSFSGLNDLKDYYGFIEEGMIEEAASLSDLKTNIDRQRTNREDVYLKTKYYNALVGEENEGESSKLSLKYISEFIAEYKG